MKRFYFIATLLFAFLANGVQAQTADAILGTWLNGSGEAKITIFKSTAGLYYGNISWLKNPLNEEGKEKVDRHNPDPKLRTKPLKGLMILRSFKHESGNVWTDGKIYDPKNGKDYSCKMTLVGNDKLDVRGYIGISLIGRTDNWTRVK